MDGAVGVDCGLTAAAKHCRGRPDQGREQDSTLSTVASAAAAAATAATAAARRATGTWLLVCPVDRFDFKTIRVDFTVFDVVEIDV